MISNGTFQAQRILIVNFIVFVSYGVCILKLGQRPFCLQCKEHLNQPSTPQQKADEVYKVSILSVCLVSTVL